MIKNRPVALLCLLFTGGVAAGLFLSFYITIPLVIISAGVISVCFIRFRFETKRLVASLLSVTLGIVCTFVHGWLEPSPTVIPLHEYEITATVQSVRATSYGKTVQLEGVSGMFDDVGFKINCNDARIHEGYQITLIGTLKEGTLLDKANGVDYIISSSEIIKCDEKADDIYSALLRARSKTSDFIFAAAGDKELAGFYSALFTGDASELPQELNASFSRSGISHILVVSGQHFSLIIMNIYLALMFILRRKKLCSGIAIVLAVLFALFTGASPSVLRAAFMCCMVFTMNFAMTSSDSFNSLMLSLTVILLFSPHAILSISLQLSFLSTMGVIFAAKYINKLRAKRLFNKKFAIIVISPILFSFTASLFCMPVFIAFFDTVSVFAPITNTLINALLTPMFVVGVPCLALARVFGFEACISLLDYAYRIIRFCSDWVADMRYACISVSLPHVKMALIPSVIAMLICPLLKIRRGIAILTSSIFAMIAIQFYCVIAYSRSLSDAPLLFIREGSASAYVIAADGDAVTLVDMNGSGSTKADVFDLGFTYIDNYIITECSEDSLKRLVATVPYVPVECIYAPEYIIGSEGNFYDFKKFAEQNDIKLYEYKPKTALEFCDTTVILPDRPEQGAFAITIESNERIAAIYGRSTYLSEINISEANSAVITMSFTESSLRPDILPDYADVIYYKYGYEDLFLSEMYHESQIKLYKSKLLLRFCDDGLCEVKQ